MEKEEEKNSIFKLTEMLLSSVYSKRKVKNHLSSKQTEKEDIAYMLQN